MNTAEVLLFFGLLWTVLVTVILAVACAIAFRIVDRVTPPPQVARDPIPPPFPAPARARRRSPSSAFPIATPDDGDAIEGRNEYPEPEAVDEEGDTSQIADDHERAMLEEREAAWSELRAEGLSDEEIAAMEAKSRIRVFD